uniref:Solute carrier family 16 member 3 n=1 Tax=Eptatretus burgeri TaxID=7764 RepID=A0A8C4Q771_EPTBU
MSESTAMTLPMASSTHEKGWSWVVLSSCFIINGFSFTLPKIISTFFKDIIHEFGVGYRDTAWFSSILLAMLYGIGPISSVLVNRFTCRPVMIAGGILASLGMIIASFCTTMIQLYVMIGITGMGLALNFQPSLVMISHYFDKRRPFANGLSASGSPAFLVIFSPLGEYLVNNYGWRGGFLIIGGLLLHCCLCGAVMRPLKQPNNQEFVLRNTDANCVAVHDSLKASRMKRPLFDFTVLKNRSSVIYLVAVTIMVLGFYVPPLFIVNYAKDIGISSPKAAFLLSVLGIVDIFARLLTGTVSSHPRVNPYTTYLFSFALLCNGLTDITSFFISNYNDFVCYCFFFGFVYGVVSALQFEVLMSIVNREMFSSAVGLDLLFESVTVLVGPPAAGYILDRTESYNIIFFTAGSLVFLSGIVIGFGKYFCFDMESSLQCKEAADSAMNNGNGQVKLFKYGEAKYDCKSVLKIPVTLEDLEEQSSSAQTI